MKQVILLNIRKLFFIILGVGFLLYTMINIGENFINIFSGFFIWIFNFLIGEYGQSKNGFDIVLFNLSNQNQVIAIGPKYFSTILTTIFAILFSFTISFLCNYFIIVKKNTFATFLKNILEWFSTIHIMIFSIIIYSIYQNDISFLMGVIIVSISSNAFYELSSLQYSDMYTLNSKDFIIAARAWGDKVSKHMKRTFMINSINQLFSLWIIFFSNCMIYEMVFQKSGLGYLLWKYFLDSTKSSVSSSMSYDQDYSAIQESSVSLSVVQEPYIFLTISMLVVITLCSINSMRNIALHYLINYKR